MWGFKSHIQTLFEIIELNYYMELSLFNILYGNLMNGTGNVDWRKKLLYYVDIQGVEYEMGLRVWDILFTNDGNWIVLSAKEPII